MIFSDTYHSALNLKHSGSLTTGGGGEGSRPRLGRDCKVKSTAKKVTFPLMQPGLKQVGKAGVQC